MEIRGHVEVSAPRINLWKDFEKLDDDKAPKELDRLTLRRLIYVECEKSNSNKITLKMSTPTFGHKTKEIELPLEFYVFEKMEKFTEFFEARKKRK